MAYEAQEVNYCYVTVSSRADTGAGILQALKEGGISLLALQERPSSEATASAAVMLMPFASAETGCSIAPTISSTNEKALLGLAQLPALFPRDLLDGAHLLSNEIDLSLAALCGEAG